MSHSRTGQPHTAIFSKPADAEDAAAPVSDIAHVELDIDRVCRLLLASERSLAFINRRALAATLANIPPAPGQVLPPAPPFAEAVAIAREDGQLIERTRLFLATHPRAIEELTPELTRTLVRIFDPSGRTARLIHTRSPLLSFAVTGAAIIGALTLVISSTLFVEHVVFTSRHPAPAALRMPVRNGAVAQNSLPGSPVRVIAPVHGAKAPAQPVAVPPAKHAQNIHGNQAVSKASPVWDELSVDTLVHPAVQQQRHAPAAVPAAPVAVKHAAVTAAIYPTKPAKLVLTKPAELPVHKAENPAPVAVPVHAAAAAPVTVHTPARLENSQPADRSRGPQTQAASRHQDQTGGSPSIFDPHAAKATPASSIFAAAHPHADGTTTAPKPQTTSAPAAPPTPPISTNAVPASDDQVGDFVSRQILTEDPAGRISSIRTSHTGTIYTVRASVVHGDAKSSTEYTVKDDNGALSVLHLRNF